MCPGINNTGDRLNTGVVDSSKYNTGINDTGVNSDTFPEIYLHWSW
jgi:hypothetical protein